MYPPFGHNINHQGYVSQEITQSRSTLEEIDRRERFHPPSSLWDIDWSFQPLYKSSRCFDEIDISSVKAAIEILRESSSTIEEKVEEKSHIDFEEKLAKAILEYDSIGLMPPKEKHTITLDIKKIKKGKLLPIKPDIL